MSKSARELQAALRARGVARDSLVVFYGDGGPEPFRLFWTLRIVANYRARVLDGGLQEWKREGRGVARGQCKRLNSGHGVALLFGVPIGP